MIMHYVIQVIGPMPVDQRGRPMSYENGCTMSKPRNYCTFINRGKKTSNKIKTQ